MKTLIAFIAGFLVASVVAMQYERRNVEKRLFPVINQFGRVQWKEGAMLYEKEVDAIRQEIERIHV